MFLAIFAVYNVYPEYLSPCVFMYMATMSVGNVSFEGDSGPQPMHFSKHEGAASLHSREAVPVDTVPYTLCS